ncbi:hypothetical protein X975_09207, partial [Stegodyphus mimosarum]
MAMRLYHRRSSNCKDRLQVPNGIQPVPALRLQAMGVCGPRDTLGANRQRSQSLFPGSPNCLTVPQRTRSRSLSFSGPSKPAECVLTALEEEHIFRCYTRVMYILLGGLAAVATGLVLYGVRTFTMI